MDKAAEKEAKKKEKEAEKQKQIEKETVENFDAKKAKGTSG